MKLCAEAFHSEFQPVLKLKTKCRVTTNASFLMNQKRSPQPQKMIVAFLTNSTKPFLRNNSMTIDSNSFETIHFITQQLRTVHLRPRHLRSHSFETFSFETTFTWVFFIPDHIHFRSRLFYATVKWTSFVSLCIRFLWSTFHFFAGDLKFFKFMPFSVQDDSRWVANALAF